MYYPYSKNKGADQIRSYCESELRLCFRLCRLLVFIISHAVAHMPCFKILGLWVMKTFEGINHIWPSWSCNLDPINFGSLFPLRLHTKLGLNWLSSFVVSEEKIFGNGEYIGIP